MNIINETTSLQGIAKIKTISRSVSMLLCNSCYWCATQLEDRETTTCQGCANAVEAIPIESGETFSFDLDSMKGVVLEFKKKET